MTDPFHFQTLERRRAMLFKSSSCSILTCWLMAHPLISCIFLQQLNFCLAHLSLDTLLICPDITDLSRLKSSVKDSFGDTPCTLRKKAASGGKIGKIAD